MPGCTFPHCFSDTLHGPDLPGCRSYYKQAPWFMFPCGAAGADVHVLCCFRAEVSHAPVKSRTDTDWRLHEHQPQDKQLRLEVCMTTLVVLLTAGNRSHATSGPCWHMLTALRAADRCLGSFMHPAATSDSMSDIAIPVGLCQQLNTMQAGAVGSWICSHLQHKGAQPTRFTLAGARLGTCLSPQACNALDSH